MIDIIKPEGIAISYINEVSNKPLLIWELSSNYVEYTEESLANISGCINLLLFSKCSAKIHYDPETNIVASQSPQNFGAITTYALGCRGAINVPSLIALFAEKLTPLIENHSVYIRKGIEIKKDLDLVKASTSYYISCRLAIAFNSKSLKELLIK